MHYQVETCTTVLGERQCVSHHTQPAA